MVYTPSVSTASITAAELRFRNFMIVSHLILFALAAALWIWRDSDFWDGNILWTCGSSLVAVSVIQNQFFNIKKIANPRNVTIGVLGLPGFSKKWEVFETSMHLYWVVGFCFIAASRWFKW